MRVFVEFLIAFADLWKVWLIAAIILTPISLIFGRLWSLRKNRIAEREDVFYLNGARWFGGLALTATIFLLLSLLIQLIA